MKTLLISKSNIAFCASVPELLSALTYRAEVAAMVYVGGDNWEPLLALARVGQQRLFDNHADDSTSWTMIALPPMIASTVCFEQRHEQQSLVLLDKPHGEWGISALNGFCTANSDLNLCEILGGGSMVFPIARWMPEHDSAVTAARSSYVKRFYDRYDSRYEQTGLEQRWCEWFRDPFFEEREKRREAKREVLQKALLNRWENGWL